MNSCESIRSMNLRVHGFIWIYVSYININSLRVYEFGMNRKNLCSSARQCGSASSASGNVCDSAHHGSVRAVCAAVACGSVLGSLWQCAQQCAAVRQCGSVRQCAAVRQSVAVRQCASVRQRVVVCATVCVQQCARTCAA
jgi:hypothetical protein